MTALAEFVDRLRLVRLERRIKSIHLARQVGVKIQSFSDWECHKKSPNDVNLAAWAGALDVPVPDGLDLHPKVAPCGSISGVRRHRRLAEPVCPPCAQAHRDYQNAWRANRKAPS